MRLLSTGKFKKKLEEMKPSTRSAIARSILELRNISDDRLGAINRVQKTKDNIYTYKVHQNRILFTIEESTSTIVLLDIASRSDVITVDGASK